MLHVLLLALLVTACAPASEPEEPRLIVLISIDQLIPDQLERLAPTLEGGLGRLWREGTIFRDANLQHAFTETGPGHATLATGTHPQVHGVPSNSFWDRATEESQYCVGDESARPVPMPEDGKGGRISTKNLRVPTLGDRLKSAYPEARLFSVAGKDRASVCLGSGQATPALWWDRTNGGFMTSTAFADELPPFVQAWNATWLEQAAGWDWERSFEGDPGQLGTGADQRPGETPFPEHGTTFPYKLPPAEDSSLAKVVFQTPLVDRFTVQMALEAVRALELGQDEVPDLLGLGLSGCDVVGHGFGPYSHEVTDLLVRVDRDLATLFDELDRTVGKGAWIAALSADHGVLPLPETLVAQGEAGRRVSKDELGVQLGLVAEALRARWPEETPRPTRYSKHFTLSELGSADPAEARAVVAAAAIQSDYTAAAYTLEQLAAPPVEGEDPYLALYRTGFVPERCPDVVLRFEPGSINSDKGTTHGSPYPYDRHVPLIFLGGTFPAQVRSDAASSADAMPTLLGRLGIEVEGVDGRDLFATGL